MKKYDRSAKRISKSEKYADQEILKLRTKLGDTGKEMIVLWDLQQGYWQGLHQRN